MASKSIFMILAFIGLIATVACADYCSICSNHVACNQNIQPSPKCQAIPKITTEMKDRIVELHNTYRNKQALGETGFPTAARMATVTWDDELAYIAYFNTKKCTYGHDACRKTSKFPTAGQNIAEKRWTQTFPSLTDVIETQTKSWFDEYQWTPKNTIDAYSSSVDPNKMIGHFTQIVRDQSYKIGCSISQYVEQKAGRTWYAVYYVCNYAVTNIINYPIYEQGAPASKCKTGNNAKYPGLCSANEKYENSPFIKYI